MQQTQRLEKSTFVSVSGGIAGRASALIFLMTSSERLNASNAALSDAWSLLSVQPCSRSCLALSLVIPLVISAISVLFLFMSMNLACE